MFAFKSNDDPTKSRILKLCFILAWFTIVVFAAANHVFWRDEVRALSLALAGSNFLDMFRAIHGEGHPAVWYILLRGAHLIWASNAVLWLVSVAVASAAVLLLALCAPFSWALVLLIIMTKFALYEYSVMARNYGISMLAMFTLAATFRRYRETGWVPGGILLVLTNTNAHSVLLAGAFILYWAIDVWIKHGLKWTASLRGLLIGSLLAGLGVVLCVATIYPPFNDAALEEQTSRSLGSLLRVVIDPASQLRDLVFYPSGPLGWIPSGVLSLLIFASVLALLPSIPALVGCGAAITSFVLFFQAIYRGGYRHEALLLVFLITLYWIVQDEMRNQAISPTQSHLRKLGVIAFVLLIAIQVPRGIKSLWADMFGTPNSRIAELAAFISQRPELHDAVLIAAPDYLLEPASYYLKNPTYFVREERFGKVVHFSSHVRTHISLDDILADAERLKTEMGRPILILIAEPIEEITQSQTIKESYNWYLSLSPENISRFQTSTTLLTRFGPATTDETYGVYLLKNRDQR